MKTNSLLGIFSLTIITSQLYAIESSPTVSVNDNAPIHIVDNPNIVLDATVDDIIALQWPYSTSNPIKRLKSGIKQGEVLWLIQMTDHSNLEFISENIIETFPPQVKMKYRAKNAGRAVIKFASQASGYVTKWYTITIQIQPKPEPVEVADLDDVQ